MDIPTHLFVEREPVINRARFGKDSFPKILRYFFLQGLGELPRLCLEYTETPYDSVMYFQTTKHKEFAPFGQMPCYQGPELGEGLYLAQSSAVCRHIARETGIAGVSNAEAALQDMLWEAGKDIGNKKDAIHSKEVNPQLDGLLKGLVKLQKEGNCLGTGDRSYGGGSSLGYGEISVYYALHTFMTIRPDSLASYPELVEFVKAAASTPSIASYLQSPRRIPLTENELGKGHTGPDGYKYVSPPKAESVAEVYIQ